MPSSTRLPKRSPLHDGAVEETRSANASYVALIVAGLWLATGAALSSRFHLVFSYDTISTVTPALEVLAVSNTALMALGLIGLTFPICVYFRSDEKHWPLGLAFALAASLPLWLVVARCLTDATPGPAIWEIIWYAILTGLALNRLSRFERPTQVSTRQLEVRLTLMKADWFWQSILCIATVGAFTWWFLQGHWYYESFRFGFNDFGHFSQRVANTAAGRGFLLETPVLSTFWDHFNPGLAFLVPFWWLWPSVYLVFALQSLSLALPALLLASIARKLGVSVLSATLWGLAWLLHPCIGQMNIAYTYGWHPVTVAVPLLLLAYRLLLSARFHSSTVTAIVASSFEEGVIVVVGCFAAAMLLRSLVHRPTDLDARTVLSMRSWFAIFVTATISFGLIYTSSGLATFQTGRFARLGNSAWEIVLSPLFKPTEFWGLLFRLRNAAFVSLFFAPFFVAGIRHSPWHVLAVALPTGVLLVWEHLPAQSIAFQYTACLFPVLFLGCIEGTSRTSPKRPKDLIERVRPFDVSCPIASIATGWVLCLFVGQMPWSQDNLIDAIGATYDPTHSEQRLAGSEDNSWLTQQIEALRNSKFTTANGSTVLPRVLATGRIASHLVGLPDVETVGQYWQRRNDLAELDPTLASPLLRYDVIVLDFLESFQQRQQESVRVLEEAISLGFQINHSRFDIQILTRGQ